MAETVSLEQMVDDIPLNEDYNGYLKRIPGMLNTETVTTGDLLNNLYTRLRLNGHDHMTSISIEACKKYISSLLPLMSSVNLVSIGNLSSKETFLDSIDQFFNKRPGQYVTVGSLKVLRDFFKQVDIVFDFGEF